MTGPSPRRRILLVINCLGWAGAETQLYHLALGLAEAGHSVTLLAVESVITDVRRLEEAGVEVVTLDVSSRREKVASVRRIARHARRADVVHCTGWDATLWGRLGAALARRPAVITEHTPGREHQSTHKRFSRARLIALHNRLLDRVTYATIAVAKWQIELLESEGVKGDSIVRIPNAVPVAELRRAAAAGPTREELGIPPEARVLVHIARFVPQKGQALTLGAAERLRERFGDVRVLFVGEGETEAAVRREAEAIGAEWATFLGRRDDVPGLVTLADASVLPSEAEGLPMTLIEAIVLGTPIVATDVGDVGDLIETTGAGECVPAGDEDAYRAACERVLGDESRRAEIVAAAERAAPEFDAPRMVRRYEEVLEAAVVGAPLPLDLEA
ncbi:MAG TPA: glycosyltransferase [Solirubrobacterales bacterium]|jgi:glycosyltransferase involved in cell wall biosynthesis